MQPHKRITGKPEETSGFLTNILLLSVNPGIRLGDVQDMVADPLKVRQ